jgi:hypothetical protein
MANCQKGSEPDEPNTAPKTGIKNVRYVIADNIINLVLVAMESTTAMSAGTLRIIPNSHKSRIKSVVRMPCTSIKTELVRPPARLPDSTILMIFHQFMPPSYRPGAIWRVLNKKDL